VIRRRDLKGRGFKPRCYDRQILQRALAPEVQSSAPTNRVLEIRPARVVVIDLPARVKVYRAELVPMGRTVKDSSTLRAHPLIYEIVKRPDGTFDVFYNGKLSHRSIPAEWLNAELAKYGICGTEYDYVCREIDKSGRARLPFRSRAGETLDPELIKKDLEQEL
jgi:hypothetical protein